MISLLRGLVFTSFWKCKHKHRDGTLGLLRNKEHLESWLITFQCANRSGHVFASVHLHLFLSVHDLHHHHRILPHEHQKLSKLNQRHQWTHLNCPDLTSDRFHLWLEAKGILGKASISILLPRIFLPSVKAFADAFHQKVPTV